MSGDDPPEHRLRFTEFAPGFRPGDTVRNAVLAVGCLLVPLVGGFLLADYLLHRAEFVRPSADSFVEWAPLFVPGRTVRNLALGAGCLVIWPVGGFLFAAYRLDRYRAAHGARSTPAGDRASATDGRRSTLRLFTRLGPAAAGLATFFVGSVTFSALVTEQASTTETELKLTMLGYYNAHFVPTEAGSRTANVLLQPPRPDVPVVLLLSIPPAVLTVAGYLVAHLYRETGTATTAARSGATVAFGYGLVGIAGIGGFAVTGPLGTTARPAPVRSVALVAVLYPVVFGGLGGYLRTLIGPSKTRSAPESGRAEPGVGPATEADRIESESPVPEADRVQIGAGSESRETADRNSKRVAAGGAPEGQESDATAPGGVVYCQHCRSSIADETAGVCPHCGSRLRG